MTSIIQRIDDFLGDDEAYVKYLEREITHLRRQQLNQPDQNGAPQGGGRSQLSSLNSAWGRWRPDEVLQHPDLPAIRQWDHPAKRSKTATPAWKRHAKGLVQRTPLAQDWWSAFRSQGIYDVMCNGTAVAFLLGDESSPPVAQGAVSKRSMLDEDFALLRHIAHYAHGATQRQMTASVAVRLAHFQQILVLSTCAVLRSVAQPSVPEEKLLEIVKICLGDVSDQYCIRMLDTAIFVNRLIDILNAHGWDGRAAELLLWCEYKSD